MPTMIACEPILPVAAAKAIPKPYRYHFAQQVPIRTSWIAAWVVLLCLFVLCNGAIPAAATDVTVGDINLVSTFPKLGPIPCLSPLLRMARQIEAVLPETSAPRHSHSFAGVVTG